MKMRMGAPLVGLMGFVALSGCLAVPPQGVNSEMRSDYVLAVKSIGCVLRTEGDYMAVELQSGLTRDQALKMTRYHLDLGTALKSKDGKSVRLITGGCKPPAKPAEKPKKV